MHCDAPARFLVIAPFFPFSEENPLVGGWINNPARLWTRAARQGHDVKVLTFGRPKGSWTYGGTEVASIGIVPGRGVINTLAMELGLLWLILRSVRGRHAQIRVHHIGGLAVLLLRRLGVIAGPIVVTAHGTTLPEISANEAASSGARPSLLVRCSRLLQYRVDRLLYRSADVVISPSRFQAAELHELYGVEEKRIEVLPHGYDEEVFQPSPDAAARAREKLGIAESETVIIMVARAAPKKGLKAFVQAARMLESSGQSTGLRFVAVVGDPLHRRSEIDVAALAENMPKTGILLRNVPECELPGLYSAARVCVVPSIGYESIPSVVYEAMGCGCTVLASRLPGIEEVVDGPFLESVDAASIARGIKMAIAGEQTTHVQGDFRLGSLLRRQLSIGEGAGGRH